MTFWGCVLKPGQKNKINISESDVLHLSQACLHQPAGGKNHLQVTAQGATYSIAILEKDKKEHETFDLFFDSADTVFSCKGNSEVHLTGYIEPTDEGMEDSEEEELVAPRSSPKASPKAASPKASPKKSPVAPPSDDDDEEDEEDEEEEEESPEPPPAKKVKTAPTSPSKTAPGSPKTTPGSPSAGPAKGAVDAYVLKMVKFLKDNGATNIGLLGSKVQRPEGVPKMKVVLEQHKDKFEIAGDKVTAK